MAIYWCTECLPLAVTALLPVIFYPMLGIMEGTEVCVQYLKDSNMLFIGGLLVAMAVEKWNLHTRIALHVLLILGVKPSLLLIGIMSTTAFLSMWISNSASTAMMLPIASAVLQQMCDTEINGVERDCGVAVEKDGENNQAYEMGDVGEIDEKKLKAKENGINKNADKNDDPKDTTENETSKVYHGGLTVEERKRKILQKYEKWRKGMCLSVCYSASIGGTATLTGTTPNVILQGQINEIYPDNGGIINFASWFGFAFPNMLIMLVLSWLWLQCMFFGLNLKKSFGCGAKKDDDMEAYQLIKIQCKNLGRMSFAEGSVLAIFTLLVLLWFTREPGFIPGWATVLFNQEKPFVTDGTVAILMSSLLFCIPSKLPCCSRRSEDGTSSDAPVPLLQWDLVHEKMPWNVILLLGGGFALAHGSDKSGLSAWLGESLIPLQNIPPFAISILLCLLVAVFTECSSNTATTSLFLPILASMATAIKIHPLYVMIPCTIAASLAFMLPVATPPNAIAFSYGKLKVIEMAKAGFMLNIIGVATINLAINTWGVALFQLDTFPNWANSTNTP